jgi:hypothetical protein
MSMTVWRMARRLVWESLGVITHRIGMIANRNDDQCALVEIVLIADLGSYLAETTT